VWQDKGDSVSSANLIMSKGGRLHFLLRNAPGRQKRTRREDYKLFEPVTLKRRRSAGTRKAFFTTRGKKNHTTTEKKASLRATDVSNMKQGGGFPLRGTADLDLIAWKNLPGGSVTKRSCERGMDRGDIWNRGRESLQPQPRVLKYIYERGTSHC